jgi:archaellin
MTKKITVIDPTGNHEENLTQWAKTLGKNKLRRKLFNAVYGRSKKPMSKKQIMQIAGIKDFQQAQNELNHLASYGLIVAQDNDGAIKDRSQILYGKDQNVRKCRKKIAALADIRSTLRKSLQNVVPWS